MLTLCVFSGKDQTEGRVGVRPNPLGVHQGRQEFLELLCDPVSQGFQDLAVALEAVQGRGLQLLLQFEEPGPAVGSLEGLVEPGTAEDLKLLGHLFSL